MSNTIRFCFSTGFELCIASSEVEDFCGSEDNGVLVWTNAILDDLIHRLEEFAEEQFDVTPYEDCRDGTHNLWLDLCERHIPPRYALGIVIFHQLLYAAPLTARRQN